jgi:hypothetical protein
MLELLKEMLSFIVELGLSLWGLVALVLGFSADMLVLLHTEMPRLEGLLVGVLLAWMLARRDRHPLLRALSAPLKLILDILDLAWDQVLEIAKDVWEVSSSWVKGAIGWTVGKVKGLFGGIMNGLKAVKDKLVKRSE